MLKVKNLYVSSGHKLILKGVDLSIGKGEIHFLMGPNGVGKSTLGLALMGHPNYKIEKGSIKFEGKYITKFSADRRAKLGMFLAFQHPLALEGVKLLNLLRLSLAEVSKTTVNPFSLKKEIALHLNDLDMSKGFMERYVNLGFSGGEKKKSEIIQALILKPKLAILDEPDSGLDIDGLKAVAKIISTLRRKQKTSLLVITHHSLIGEYLKPDFVHVMIKGRIVKSGDRKLMKYIEKNGYKNF